MSSFDFSAFDAAVTQYYGSITGLLTQECGCQVVHAGGANTSLICPNHGDNKKNQRGNYLHANDQKGSWKCWKCENEGSHIAHAGYAVEAIMEYRHMDRKEAFRYLCDKVGFKTDEDYEYRDSDVRSMFVRICQDLLQEKANEPEYAVAIDYLHSRGFNDYQIKKHAGFCVGFEAVSRLRKKGFKDERLYECGILNRSKKSGKFYPAFNNRIVLMIGDNLYGRTIDPENSLRHLYSRGKNSLFNGMMLGREWDKIFVVESAFDAISIEQYISELGANWCVIGTCGTKGIKTPELVKLLKECFPAEVVVIPDCDSWYNGNHIRHAPGQKAGLAKARAFEAAGLKTRVLVLPANSDPNDLTKNGFTAEQFEQMVQVALSPVKYAIYCEAHYHRCGSSHSANISFLNEVRKSLIKYKVYLSSEVFDYLEQLTKESRAEIERYMCPSLKKSDALDYVRSEVIRGRNIDDVLAEIRQALS